MENSIVDVFMKEIQDLRFKNADELYNRKEYIRINYEKLSKSYKEMYKWYFFYQLCIIKRLELKNLLWSYLNSNGENVQLNKDLWTEYNKFCKEKERISKLNNKQMLVYEDGGFNLL